MKKGEDKNGIENLAFDSSNGNIIDEGISRTESKRKESIYSSVLVENNQIESILESTPEEYEGENGKGNSHNNYSNIKSITIKSTLKAKGNSELQQSDPDIRKTFEKVKKISLNAAVFVLLCLSTFALLYILFGNEILPGGSIFTLASLILLSIVLGHVYEFFRLPPLLGMLLGGILLRNCVFGNSINLKSSLFSPLRGMSVVVLLTRGALSVRPSAIKKYARIVPTLSIGACLAEAFAMFICAHFILDLPLYFAALFGAIVSAMSQTCVLPYLNYMDKLFPGQKCIEIAKAACGLDPIPAIFLAEVWFGFIFSEGNVSKGFMKGPLEILYGLIFGVTYGSIIGFLLQKNTNTEIRTFCLFAGGSLSIVGMFKLGVPRGGPLGCYIIVLIASSIWRIKGVDGENNDKLNAAVAEIWYFFQPLLFGIIGIYTDLTSVDWTIIMKGVICQSISLTVRVLSVFAIMSTGNEKLSVKEKLFICLSWIPKGTLQAALGPVALETYFAYSSVSSEIESNALNIMHLSILSGIIGAIVGSFLFFTVASKLLEKENNSLST